MAVTLDQLLASRDERQRLQHQAIARNPGLTLMVLTVVMPGPEKRTHASLTVGRAATEAIRSRFADMLHSETIRDLDTGFEGWFILRCGWREAKAAGCAIEETHPLGRLFDIDVFDPSTCAPVSRQAIGLEPRRCLICDAPARECMRARLHTPQEIQDKIRLMVTDYESRI